MTPWISGAAAVLSDTPLMTETQERFLRAVLTRVPLDSVVEMHLFPPIRRGTLETGVAVIATALPPEPRLAVAPEWGDGVLNVEALPDVGGGADDEPLATRAVPSPRLRIFTASYRHTIKGVERGKWTFDVHEEADAPPEAVELVLRGVRHRSTEPADPEQVSLAELTVLVAPARVAPAA